jgi:hypothetical protein
VLASGFVHAGEIAGIAPQLPPFIGNDLQLTFSNDFLGRGGSVDDFRTQQFIVSGRVAERWLVALDHSILTLDSDSVPGRTDQLSLSLGYELVAATEGSSITAVAAGLGTRSSGEFAGERMQNGFHRLVGSGIENLPYTDVRGTDGTLWVTAEQYRHLHGVPPGSGGGWGAGYWIRAGSLLTSGGQWDSSAAGFVVASKRDLGFWVGVRRDWRHGYDDPVLRETAAAEDDLALVLGARWRSLVVETVQQIDNEASYGQVRVVTSPGTAPVSPEGLLRFALDSSVVLPDVEFRIAARLRLRALSAKDSLWRTSLLLGASYGEPQYGDNAEIYRRARQVDAGIDFERPLALQGGGIAVYAGAAAGWRGEQLLGDGSLEGNDSVSVDSAVIALGTGLRITVDGSRSWLLRANIGLVGRLSLDDASVEFAGRLRLLQENAVRLVFGLILDFE